VPTISTARLTLRPSTLSDVGELWRLWTDQDVRRYLWDDIEIPRERALDVVTQSVASFADRGLGYWVISPRDDRTVIGFTGVTDLIDPAHIQLLYGLYPAYWGRGLATEAGSAMLRYGFERLGLERIYAGADPPNVASIRVMERLGMKFALETRIKDLDVVYYARDRDGFAPTWGEFEIRS
jgi:[ribosomal protein S5]-alanine N-acetyltransferase